MTKHRMNSAIIDVDVVVDSKEPTLFEDELSRLFKAKCEDLLIPAY